MKTWRFNEKDVKAFLYGQDNYHLSRGLTELEMAENMLNNFANFLEKIEDTANGN